MSNPKSSRRRPPEAPTYFERSKSPLHVLVFVLPLIVAYELGLALLFGTGEAISVSAHVSLLELFDAFGISARGGLLVGGLTIVIVLLLWHVLRRDPWKVDVHTVGLMAGESVALTVPLLILAMLAAYVLPAAATTIVELAASADRDAMDPAQLSRVQRMVVSIGAGLYEELVFRMLFIAVLHTLLVDVLNATDRIGAAVGVAVSAAAFALYHQPADGWKMIFYFVMGVYFGVLFLIRGFGIVVAVHALYDVLVLWSPAGSPPAS